MRRAFSTLALLLLVANAALGDEAGLTALKSGGRIAIIRHGETTPGVSDPPGFKLDDCATQRNLIDKGRAESRKLGELLRARGVAFERVLSSEWCRCVETAELIAAGKVEKNSALNNLFGRPQNRAGQVEALRKLIAGWKGGNLLLVTHGATMGAFMGVNPDTAAGVVIEPAPGTQEGFRVVGKISPEG